MQKTVPIKRNLKVCGSCQFFEKRRVMVCDYMPLPYYACDLQGEDGLAAECRYEGYPVPKECTRQMEMLVMGQKQHEP